jgi:TolB-like protein
LPFLAELKRRNVIRMAGLYLVGAWLVVQVAGTVLPMFGAPDWVARTVVILLAIGFIPALVFAWIYELTPEGLKRDGEVSPAESIAPQTARRMDRMLLVVMALALGFFAVDKFMLGVDRAPTASQDAASTAPAADSPPSRPVIAVLPFANLSGKADEDYFSDGMTEELLIVLARVPQMQVVARTSVFEFKGKGGDVREIGRQLGVSHLVEGSVRRDGEQVRISAQLVQVSDGTEVWSESFDRKLDSVFALQDEIAARIREQLVSSLVVSPGQTARTAIDPVAYDEYLKGRALLRARKDLPAAIAHFRAATEQAPGLAAAWSSMTLACEALLGMDAFPAAEQQRLIDCQVEGAGRAAELEPDAAASAHALANLARTRFRYADAETHYLRAIQLDPGYPDAREDYAELLFQVGRVEESARQAENLVNLDPYFIVGWIRMRDIAFARDRRSDVEMVSSRLRSLYPDNAIGWWMPYGTSEQATTPAPQSG